MKIAISTPIGTAINAAMPTRIAEPTISGAIPPPGWPKSGRSFVRKPIESWEAPRFATDHTTIASTATATSAAIRATASASSVRRAVAGACGGRGP